MPDSDRVVVVSLDNGKEYKFDATDESGIAKFLYDLCGERICEHSFVPVALDASGWCRRAKVGSIYHDECFEIMVIAAV